MPNNMIEVFLTDVVFLYTINIIHEESMSLPDGS